MNPYPCTRPANRDFGTYLDELLRYASPKERARIKREYGEREYAEEESK